MKENDSNFNLGTTYGRDLIKRSLQELGCARSIVLDKNDVVIAGKDVFRAAQELGKKIITIETDGDVLVAVKRRDVEADSKKGKEIALVDNLAQEKNLNWDADKLLDTMNTDLSFDPRTWGGYECIVKELELQDLLRDDVPVKEKKEKKEEVFVASAQLSLFDYE